MIFTFQQTLKSGKKTKKIFTGFLNIATLSVIRIKIFYQKRKFSAT